MKLTEQQLRWKEKITAAYREQTGPYRDELTIAAEMLDHAEDRENRMAEACAATRGHVDKNVTVIFRGDPAWGYIAEWDDSRKAYVTKDVAGADHSSQQRKERTCTQNRECALKDGHDGGHLILGNA